MSSSRLPGKVLLDIGGEPMLARVVTRARRARTAAEVVVATTTSPADDPVAALCQARGYPFYRGSLQDVLDRYYQAARRASAQVVVRITADCPLIDPALIDETVRAFFGLERVGEASLPPRPAFDFAANRLPPPWKRTIPIGLDIEVCTFAALERAWQEADQPHQREHVMPYFYDHAAASGQNPNILAHQPRPDAPAFRILLVNHEPDYGSLRWTVDTAQDLELVRQIYAHFAGRDDFAWQDVLSLLARRPELAQINAGVPAKDYRAVDTRRSEPPDDSPNGRPSWKP